MGNEGCISSTVVPGGGLGPRAQAAQGLALGASAQTLTGLLLGDLPLRYHHKETLFFAIDPHYANLNKHPYQQSS